MQYTVFAGKQSYLTRTFLWKLILRQVFSALRSFAICDRNVPLSMLVLMLDLVPVFTNLVSKLNL